MREDVIREKCHELLKYNVEKLNKAKMTLIETRKFSNFVNYFSLDYRT